MNNNILWNILLLWNNFRTQFYQEVYFWLDIHLPHCIAYPKFVFQSIYFFYGVGGGGRKHRYIFLMALWKTLIWQKLSFIFLLHKNSKCVKDDMFSTHPSDLFYNTDNAQNLPYKIQSEVFKYEIFLSAKQTHNFVSINIIRKTC
jgi:hypothetical protein